ncbi:MAG: Gldg family protein [Verrucomicrobiota bacterium]
MATQKKSVENFLFSIGGIIAMFFVLVGIYIISHVVSRRVDLTEEKTYTLSPGTKAILKKLDTPVTIRFYATQSKEMPVELKTYAQRVEDILEEYKKFGGNKIQIKKYNPEPDSDAEDSANLDGIEGQQVSFGDKIYLGLAVRMLDEKVAIPFLTPQRERLLEYDITRAIANVTTTEKPVVGVMSSLPVFGQMNPMMMMQGGGRQEPWIFINELKQDFTVKEIQTSVDKIDDDVRILLLIHPKNLSDKALYAIDQFIMRGGKLMAFLDPLSIVDSQNAPQNNPLQGAMNASSSIDKLTKAWGIQFDSSKVVADMLHSTKINQGGAPEDAPAVLSLTEDSVNTNEVVTSQIDNLLLPFAGVFTGTPAGGLKQTVLLHTSPQSQLVEKFMAQFSGAQIEKDFKASGQEYTLALRLVGKFKTAFPEGKPQESAAGEDDKKNQTTNSVPSLKESKETSVILVGDSDMIYYRFAAQVQNLFGQRLVFPMNGNLNLVQNIVEQNAGDENLIAIRSRATMNRPFTRVRKMEVAAQDRYRSKIKELESSLQETQNRVNELQKTKENGQKFILSPEQQAELAKFQEKQVQVRKELKDVRKDLHREIDSLENRLKWINIAGMPLVVTIAGVSLALLKRRKTAAK